MSLVSVNLTLILNYQVHCGLIAFKTFDAKYATCGGSFVDYGTNVMAPMSSGF